MQRIPLSKVGNHVDMHGQGVAFGEVQLKASATAYDPELHEAPIVVGHPQSTTAPAFGWVKSLAFGEDGLIATPKQVDPAFAECVLRGNYKKVSARFYNPKSPRNPVPGVYYLRDVGFLGGMPPAVKGLPDVEFAEDQSDLVTCELEFAETSDWTLSKIFRGLRDYLIEREGLEKADTIIPDWAVEESQMAAMMPHSAEPDMSFSETEETVTDTDREKDLLAREAALIARELEASRRDHAAFAETVKGIHPAQKGAVVELLCHLDAAGVEDLSFAEGDKTVERSPVETFKTFLTGLPELVPAGSLPGETDDVSFAEDPGKLGRKAAEYITEQATKGITVSPTEAVAHVQGK